MGYNSQVVLINDSALEPFHTVMSTADETLESKDQTML